MGNGLTLTLGLRADKPNFDTTPSFNPAVQTALGFNTSDVPSEKITWEPRVGFNWDIGGAGKQQLRGGIGVFDGRTPFVWISNAYGGTGVEQVSSTCSGALHASGLQPRSEQPAAQPRRGCRCATSRSSDPDFQFPRVLRATLGYDRELFWGIRGSAEVLCSQTQQDVFYHNVNEGRGRREPARRPQDATRPISQARFGNAYFLTNTDEGEEFTADPHARQGLRPPPRSPRLYAHQNAESVGDCTSSTAGSNWQFGYISRTGDSSTRK